MKYHRLVGLSDRHLFLTVLKTGKSEIKVSADSIPDEDSSWLANGCLLSVFSHRRRGVGESALVASSSSYKVTNLIIAGTHPYNLI